MLTLKAMALASCLFVSSVLGGFVTYPRPDIYTKSAHFSLKVNGTFMNTVNYAGYDYVQFSMSEGYNTEIRIELMDQPAIKSWSISPKQLPIKPTVDGKAIVFSLKKAHYLIIKLNDAKEFVVLIDPPEKDVPDSSGSGIYNVLSYNADKTGKTVTKAIQKALDAAGNSPGGIVFVPPGLYLVGNLVIPSDTSLYLAGGAVLRFTGNPSDYTTMYTKSDLGPGTWWIRTVPGSANIKVYGRGTIDGNGFNTRKNKFMSSALVPAGTLNFRADGILVRDSSFWAVMPVQSEGVYLVNLKILDRFDVTQNDGVDVCESTRVTVRRTIAIANDDSFSAKTWPFQTGTTVPYPYPPRDLKNVLFDDCLAWTRCYGYKIGEGVWQNQRNVTFKNSVVYYAGVGLGIHHKFGSAAATDITFDNIDIEDLGGSPGGQAAWLTVYVNNVNSGIGPITDINVKNIRARKQGARPGLLQGADAKAMVSRVTLSNIYMYENTSPATTLKQMNLLGTDFSSNIKIANT